MGRGMSEADVDHGDARSAQREGRAVRTDVADLKDLLGTSRAPGDVRERDALKTTGELNVEAGVLGLRTRGRIMC